MCKQRFLPAFLLFSAACAWAQLASPNGAGVAMGHLHCNVADIEANKSFWSGQLGGTPVKLGPLDGIKFPGVIVFLRKADPSGPTEGSVINHIGFLVRDLDTALANWTAAG